jgi:hypothetical protein
MILIRYFLVGLIVYLVVRSFMKLNESAGHSAKQDGSVRKDNEPAKKVSKEIGEYVDYEEIKKQ